LWKVLSQLVGKIRREYSTSPDPPEKPCKSLSKMMENYLRNTENPSEQPRIGAERQEMEHKQAEYRRRVLSWKAGFM
jgi:hypothetical protein